MNIGLTPQQEAMIQEKVENGLYATSSEVVREAPRLLEERDRRARLRAALEAGDEDLVKGKTVEWTPELMDDIWQEGVAAAAAGEAPDPDVCP